MLLIGIAALRGLPASAQIVSLVKDVEPGAPDGGIYDLTPALGRLFFGSHGRLWVSDGTPAGTTILAATGGSQGPTGFMEQAGFLYFQAGPSGGALWRTDGTASGTKEVVPCPGTCGAYFNGLVGLGGGLAFAGQRLNDWDLWWSDGSAPGTRLVASFTGQAALASRSMGGVLYFAAYDAVNGTELWRTDGTPGGTRLVKDIRPGLNGSLPAEFVSFQGVQYFFANDGRTGYELWKTDGTAEGTVLVKDTAPGGSWAARYASPGVALSRIFFLVDALDDGIQLWKSDGTTSGTELVKVIQPGYDPSRPADYVPGFTEFRGAVYFQASDGVSGFELWRSDGTAAGTRLVKDILPGAGSGFDSSFSRMTDAGSTLLFRASDGISGTELWSSDGTEAGTRMLADLNPGPEPSFPGRGDGSPIGPFVNLGATCYLVATTATLGRELYRVDLPTPPEPRGFYIVEPCRAVDTRAGTGPLAGPALQPAATRVFALAGTCGVPADAASVSLNVTVVNPTSSGSLVLHAAGTPVPETSTITFAPGQTRANNAITRVDGTPAAGLAVTSFSLGTVDVIVDVNGYFR